MRERVLAVMALAAIAGCSKADPERARGAGDAGGGDAVAAAAPAGPVLGEPKTYRLSSQGVELDVTVRVPTGWHEQRPAGWQVLLHTMTGSKIGIGLGCMGVCGQVAANVAATAKERFAWVTDDGHVPKLAPVWDQEPTETSPGVWRYAFHGKTTETDRRTDWEEHYVVVDRAVGGLVLDCSAEPVTETLAIKADLAKVCDELTFTVVTPPAAVADAAPVAAGAGAVTLGYQVPAVGATWTDTETSTLAMSGPRGQMTSTKKRVRKVVVEAASDVAVTRAVYSYPELSERTEVNGKIEDAPSLLVGKAFVLDATDGKVDVLGSSGLATPAEIEAVLDDEEHFGQPEALERVLAGRSFEPGIPVRLTADELARIQAERPSKLPYTELRLTLIDAADGVATFNLEMVSGDGGATRMAVTGTMKVVIATGVAIDASMRGTISSAGADGTIEFVAHRE